MRSHRILAASAAAALLTVGLTTGTASAVGVPTESCYKGTHHTELDTKVTGFPAALPKGAAPVDSTVTYRNNSGHAVKDFHTSLHVGFSDGAWPAGSFTAQIKLPGAAWKTVPFGVPSSENIIDTGTYQLAKDEVLTIQFRLAANDKAPVGDYSTSLSGGSPLLDDDNDVFLKENEKLEVPANGKGTCTQFVGYGDLKFKVVAAETAKPSPTSPTTSATPTATATPTPSPSATPTKKATPSATTRGPELAATGGGSSSTPLAIGGGVAVLLGAGVLVALRRRGKRA